MVLEECLYYLLPAIARLTLSDHIRHFEPVFYDTTALQEQHRRAKRSPDVQLQLHFYAHNRHFKLRLKRDASIFADDVIFESTRGVVRFDQDKVYSGTLLDDELAQVQGVVTSDGLFDGHILTSNEVYYLEPAQRYLDGPDFHSVMYKASDVTHPVSCATRASHFSRSIASSAPGVFNSTAVNSERRPLNQSVVPASTAARDALFKARRKKRSPVDNNKTTCMLYLQADHLFYQKIGTEEACIESITRHVQRVNSIYKVTDFDLDGRPDNIGFMIKRIKIHTPEAQNDPSYRFPGNYGVEKFLELFSEEDYDAFCLAYMFTYRDFEGGTLGLAWTGDLKNAGGVCEKNGHYRGSLKSLNTGIVTLLNYGKHVPPAVSHVTLAHEIGHNFGSPHDPEEDMVCTPGGEDGNYIMFARATSGDKRNNNRFSPCSLKQINSVLNTKARDFKGCFTKPQTAICGNGVVETGEECDCGWEEDCNDRCCFPMTTNPRKGEAPCTLRPKKICSPSQGPCCTADCQLKEGAKCRDDNGCRDSAFCDGRGPHCPPSINKPNKTICNEEFVCYKGECTGSICLAYGMESCQCIPGPGEPETKACELCCKLPGENQPCISSFEWNEHNTDIPDLYAKPGTPCNNYKGYCDVFRKCREVDPSGPLATLRKLLLSDESLANLHKWVVDYWYAVLFITIAVIIILIAIIRFFGTPAESLKQQSSRKKKKKKTVVHKNILPNSNDFTIPMPNGTSDCEANVIQHKMIRKNIPFRRKVKEVQKAATKAKIVAKSQLGRPRRKPKTHRSSDGAVTSPTESEKSVPDHLSAVVDVPMPNSKSKEKVSCRFSIISFKTFRTKSPEKRSGVDSKKAKVTSDKYKKRSHMMKNLDKRTRTRPESPEKVQRSGSPCKKDIENGRRKPRYKSSSPDKHFSKGVDKNQHLEGTEWLIKKFLADEEKVSKSPETSASLRGSMNSLLPVSNSPLLTPTQHSSVRGLLAEGSPMRGFINEGFISSPRGMRAHSSLRVAKTYSPEKHDFFTNKYRRSVSMEAYNRACMGSERRKRPVIDASMPEKKRRFSSPEKPVRSVSLRKSTKAKSPDDCLPTMYHNMKRRHSSSSVLPTRSESFSVPNKIKQKLALISDSPSGSVTSVLLSMDAEDAASVKSNHSQRTKPKDWV